MARCQASLGVSMAKVNPLFRTSESCSSIPRENEFTFRLGKEKETCLSEYSALSVSINSLMYGWSPLESEESVISR